MADLHIRQEKFQAKAKQLSFRDFLKNIVSRYPVVLYKNNKLVSKFPPTPRMAGVMDHQAYGTYRDGLVQDAKPGDVIGKFFQDFQSLRLQTKLPNLISFMENENTKYADIIIGVKNCYLSIGLVNDCENVLYSCTIKDHCRNIINSMLVLDSCENIYFSSGVIQSYNVFYSRAIHNSSNIRFSSNLIGCTECISCDNLNNVSYYIHNKKYDKEEYLKLKKELLAQKDKFSQWHQNVQIKANPIVSSNVSGNNIIQSDDIQDGYYIYNVHGGKNCIFVGTKEGNKNIYSTISAGSPSGNDEYSNVSINGDNIYCCGHCSFCGNMYYSYFCDSCSFCIGCVGLKNKQFCILNKQYTKEQRYELANEIFKKMEADGTLGDFFPASMCPFYFNDTAAYLIDDTFTKEEAIKEGYLRHDDAIKVDVPEGAEIIGTKDLDHYQGFDEKKDRTINPDILDKVICDEKGNYYKIVKMELDFLQKYGLPLPALHRLDRIKLGFKFK